MTIDPYSDVAIYLQVAALLREQIATGAIPPRHPLPSAKALTQQHGIAVGTAVRAIDLLRSEGLVRTVPGKGVYVLPPEERGK